MSAALELQPTALGPALARLAVLERTGRARLAAVDMDFTLFYGDIGESVLAALWADRELRTGGLSQRQAYERYAATVEAGDLLDGEHPYVRAATVMAGLSARFLEEKTRQVLGLSSPLGPRTAQPWEPPRPTPIRHMHALVHALLARDYRVVVVTSTNEISARVACAHFLSIDARDVLGIANQRNERDELEEALQAPVPLREQKVAALEAWARREGWRGDRADDGRLAPLLSAGDSHNDRFLMELVSDGVRIWVGGRPVPEAWSGDDRLVRVPWASDGDPVAP